QQVDFGTAAGARAGDGASCQWRYELQRLLNAFPRALGQLSGPGAASQKRLLRMALARGFTQVLERRGAEAEGFAVGVEPAAVRAHPGRQAALDARGVIAGTEADRDELPARGTLRVPLYVVAVEMDMERQAEPVEVRHRELARRDNPETGCHLSQRLQR